MTDKELKDYISTGNVVMMVCFFILLALAFGVARLQLRHIQSILCEQHPVESCKP